MLADESHCAAGDKHPILADLTAPRGREALSSPSHAQGTETQRCDVTRTGLEQGAFRGPRHGTFEFTPSTRSFDILDVPSPHFRLCLFSLFSSSSIDV